MNSRQSNIIVRPLLNEKAASMSMLGKFTFEVVKDANKIEIAHAVDQLLKERQKKGQGNRRQHHCRVAIRNAATRAALKPPKTARKRSSQ